MQSHQTSTHNYAIRSNSTGLKMSPDTELLLTDNTVFLYRLVCQCQVEKLVLTIQPASVITSTSLENFGGKQNMDK
jgi:hypothetical protein